MIVAVAQVADAPAVVDGFPGVFDLEHTALGGPCGRVEIIPG